MSKPIPQSIKVYYSRLFIESFMEAGGDRVVSALCAIDPQVEAMVKEAGAKLGQELSYTIQDYFRGLNCLVNANLYLKKKYGEFALEDAQDELRLRMSDVKDAMEAHKK